MKANIGSASPDQSRTVLLNHQPIILGKKAKADNGTLPDGRVLALDANDLLVSFNPAAVDPETPDTTKTAVGVLTQELDTTTDDTATVIVHGTVRKSRLTVSGGAAPSATVIAALAAIGIFAI